MYTTQIFDIDEDDLVASSTNIVKYVPEVRLKKLPFYDVIETLLDPFVLIPCEPFTKELHETTFKFILTPEQATEIGMNRNVMGAVVDYEVQVQLRCFLLDTTSEQEDCFPPDIEVIVNNQLCTLPKVMISNRPNVEPKRLPRPVDVTSRVKLSPIVTNIIKVQWRPASDLTKKYVISAYLVRKLTSQKLLERLQEKEIISPDHTRSVIQNKFIEDADNEIATTMFKMPLLCPLTKLRMSIPCRASTCSHLQCFDASSYLQMNEKKPSWICPVCGKPAEYESLKIDGYFKEVLTSPLLSSNDDDIQLHVDGSWSVSKMANETHQII